MREIIFRGKRKDNGEWVEGGFVHQTDFYGIKIDEYRIIDGTETEDNNIGFSYEVIPETVGQFTGLTDKNGLTKIFEGDVLKIPFGKEFFKAVVKFGYYNQRDQIRKTHLGFYFDFVDSESYRKDVGFWGKTFSKIEVIGNIHDNPELLNK